MGKVLGTIKERQRKIISFNDYVILTLPSGATKIIEVRRDGTISLGKFGIFGANYIVGYSYGQSFEILENKRVQPLKSITYGLEDADSNESTPIPEFSSSEDNRNLVDKGDEVQKVTAEEIEKIKKQGGGNEIANKLISKIIEGHESFDKKTVYSQDKYVIRKQRKFSRRFTVNALSPSNLLNHMRNDREMDKIQGLSEEVLGMMMSHANVMPGGNYLVMDETGGIVVYAMLERMHGEGTITLLHENDQPKIAHLMHTNYSEEELYKMVKPINLLQFMEPADNKPNVGPFPDDVVKAMPDMRRKRYYRRMKKVKQLNESLDMVEHGAFDGLVYVSTLNPVGFVPKIVNKIAGSRSIVVYSQYKEILIGLSHIFLRDKHILLPNIYESRVRHFQTIPGRLHPTMTSVGGGGYFLSGIKVIPTEGAVASGRRSKKRAGVEQQEEVKKIKLASDSSA